MMCLLAIGWAEEAWANPNDTNTDPSPGQEVERRTAAEETQRRKTVYFDVDGGPVTEPDNWSPVAQSHLGTYGLLQALAEPLFVLNFETGEFEPWLAERMWANEALDIWTLKLRPGIRWSDGEALDAEDVVFTVDLLRQHAPRLRDSDWMERLIQRVEPVDALTVRFHLKQANARFQLLWAAVIVRGPVILPEHIWRNQNPITFKNWAPARGWPVFTGPYRLERFSKTEFVFVRNNRWWGAETGWRPLPKPERLVWVAHETEEQRTTAMAENRVDSLMDISPGGLLNLKRRNPRVITHHADLPFAWVPDPCVRTLDFNHAVPPWNDKQMRWALNYAIDRKAIVAFTYNGTTVAARLFLPAYPKLNRYVNLLDEAGLYRKYPLMEYDPRKTKAILTSKGYSLNTRGRFERDGKELSLVIGAQAGHLEIERVAQVVVEQLQQAGIAASLRSVPSKEYLRTLSSGGFEAMAAWSPGGAVIEPWTALDIFNIEDVRRVGEWTPRNRWRWSGAAANKYSRLVNAIGMLPLDDPKIDALFVQAMDLWLDELPVIPLTQARRIIPFNTTYWTGWPTAKNNYIQPPTWWQSVHLIIHHLAPVEP